MSTLWLTIDTGNDAMQDERDLAGALRRTADDLELNGQVGGNIKDDNGQTVGHWEVRDV